MPASRAAPKSAHLATAGQICVMSSWASFAPNHHTESLPCPCAATVAPGGQEGVIPLAVRKMLARTGCARGLTPVRRSARNSASLEPTARTAMTYDLILRGGRVIDPSQRLDAVTDVAFSGGKVAKVGPKLQGDAEHRRARRRGQDRHARPDRPAHPRLLGRHVARHRGRGLLAAPGGVTTAIDTGSAGPGNFPGFRKHVIEPSPGAHPRLPARLLRRHLRLLQDA